MVTPELPSSVSCLLTGSFETSGLTAVSAPPLLFANDQKSF